MCVFSSHTSHGNTEVSRQYSGAMRQSVKRLKMMAKMVKAMYTLPPSLAMHASSSSSSHRSA